mmetsp:Transcript_62602/g.164284  ORF Transcript_62602/g.164284 Transcript_62602/m.164284 type:complete len:547 (-) Transcript_62602:70-1710(-)
MFGEDPLLSWSVPLPQPGLANAERLLLGPWPRSIRTGSSGNQLLELLRHRARAELVVGAEDELARRLARDAAVDHAVEQGVATETVVAVHTAGDLACGVHPRDHTLRADALGLRGDLQAAHAVVDHRGDDRHEERLARHLVAGEHVVVELLAAARRAARLVPGLARGVRGVLAAIRVLLGLLRRIVVLVVGIDERLQRDAHILGQVGARVVELHHATARVVLAVPDDLVRGRLVQAETEGRRVLPHLTGDVVTAAELVREALALGVKHDAAHATQRLRGKELDLGIRVIRLHEAGRVHLNPLQVDGLGADGLADLDGVTSAVLAVRGRQVQEVRTVLGQQGVVPEVRAVAARGPDHGAVLLEERAALLVVATHDGRPIHDEADDLRLRDDPRPVRLLRDLLQHLNQSVGDGHAREALRAAVRARLRVASEAGQQGEVQVELVHKPVHIRSAVNAEHLGELGLLRAALERVRDEELGVVRDALRLLGLGARAVDAGGGLRGVAAAERGLVQQHRPPATLHDLIRGGHAAQAAADHDHLVRRENLRHG